MTIILERRDYTDHGTFGVIRLADKLFNTLELPWDHNNKDKSCIPIGTYEVMFTWSPSFRRRLYLVCDVPGRTGIRIHPANTFNQLNGCIALGYGLGEIKGVKAVTQSRIAVDDFSMLLEHKPFKLQIMDGMKLEIQK